MSAAFPAKEIMFPPINFESRPTRISEQSPTGFVPPPRQNPQKSFAQTYRPAFAPDAIALQQPTAPRLPAPRLPQFLPMTAPSRAAPRPPCQSTDGGCCLCARAPHPLAWPDGFRPQASRHAPRRLFSRRPPNPCSRGLLSLAAPQKCPAPVCPSDAHSISGSRSKSLVPVFVRQSHDPESCCLSCLAPDPDSSSSHDG